MAMAWSWVRVSCLVLLFSGCLAAVVNKGTPEAPVAPEETTPTLLTLIRFTWNIAAEEAGRGAGLYESLEVCYEEQTQENLAALRVGDDEYTLLVYIKEFQTLVEFGKGSAKQNCVKFTKDDADIEIPSGNVTYQLHIASADGTTQKKGVAEFEIDLAEYEMPQNVVCGDSNYTRAVNTTPRDCTSDGGVSAGNKICYTPAVEGEVGPDPDGCITNAGVWVCLSDMAGMEGPSAEGTVTVDSLTYSGDKPASLGITYTPANIGPTSFTSLEYLMQDSNATLVYAGACSDGPNRACDITGYNQQVKAYQVCVVGVTEPDVLSYTPDDSTITDLNLVGYPETDTDTIEFGFNNAREDPDRYYYASVVGTDGQKIANAVGIDCQRVDTGHTCYGFLDITDLGDAVQLTVEYGDPGDGSAGVISKDENKIIGTYTNITPSTTVLPKGGPQVEE